MMTATQAKEKTTERLQQLAKEYITNIAEPAIDQAIKNGRFYVTPSFKEVINPEQTGVEVVKLLQAQGFEAEHVYYDGAHGYDNYILIKWEEV